MRRLQPFVHERQGRTVVRLQYQQSERSGSAAVDQFLDADQVADGLGHLFAAQLQQPVVYPVP